MKAAVVTSFTEPLQIRDVPVPVPGPGQVLVRIEVCGLCHTDIHAARGDWPVKPTPPFIPGHEGVGIIEGVGAGVAPSRVGQRVAIAWLGWACGYCEFCVSGHETLCESQEMSGYSIDGAYAEYAVASSDFVVPVPARPSEPRDRHPLPDPALGYIGANPLDDSDAFVARDQGQRRLDRPVTARGMNVGMAEAADLDPHQHLPWPGHRHRQVENLQRFRERRNDSSFHRVYP